MTTTRARYAAAWFLAIGSLAIGSLRCNSDVQLGAWQLSQDPDRPGPSPVGPQVVPSASAPDDGKPGPSVDAGRPVPPTPSIDSDGGSGQGPTDSGSPPPRSEAGPPDADSSEAGAPGESPPEAGLPLELPVCGALGQPGPLSAPGDPIASTVTYTDWSWPAPMESVEFELRVETDVANETVFWTYQYTFVAGVVGLLGFQDRGLYQADPPDGPVEYTRMAFFWISGPPLSAELGDVPYPQARTSPEFSRGVPWTSIHVRYDWETCQPYRFRLALESTADMGNRWYGAWVQDVSSGEETFLGRMLVPEAWGQLSAFSSMWANRFSEVPFTSCNDIEHASAIFGPPIGNYGGLLPSAVAHRFESPTRCPTSRITAFERAVRHELGLDN